MTDRLQLDAVGHIAAALDLRVSFGTSGDPKLLLEERKHGFRRVKHAAQRVGPFEAASELTTVYLREFEPLERYFLGRRPQEVRPLEIKFSDLRGDVSAGLTGEPLTARIDSLSTQIEKLVEELEAQPAGLFGSAFLASFITISARSGVEVILILAMLLALVGKATNLARVQATDGSDPATSAARAIGENDLAHALGELKKRAVRAIWWGVAAAALASAATAIALNLLIFSAPGAAREMLEGTVMLVAAAVLFYVSYWLVSRFEAKRWTDYLAGRARRGIELGGQGTLALTAFLAVYREGAETSCCTRRFWGAEGRTRVGLLGLAAVASRWAQSSWR